MNAAEITNTVAPSEDFETATVGSLGTQPRPSPRTQGATLLRHALLLGIALLSAWLVITVLHSINELNTEIERIYAVVTLPVR